MKTGINALCGILSAASWDEGDHRSWTATLPGSRVLPVRDAFDDVL